MNKKGVGVKMKFLKIIAILLLLLPLISSVMAASCDLIKLDTKVIEAYNNQTETATFTLSNYSAETFHVDRIEIHDFEHGIISRITSFEKEVKPNSTIPITVEFEVFDKQEGTYKAFIQARGHFQDFETCNYMEIKEKEIPIIIKKKIENSNGLKCSEFDVMVPEKIGFINNEGNITINVYNLSGTGMNILLTGNNIKLQTNFIHLPDNTEKNISFPVKVEKEKTWLFYTIEVPGCKIYTKKTEISLVENTGNVLDKKNITQKQDNNTEAKDFNANTTATAFASFAGALTQSTGLLLLIFIVIIAGLITAVYIKDQHIREQQNLEWVKEKITATTNN